MGKVKCQFNTVNGNNTASWCRTGPSSSYKKTTTLVRKNCPDGVFYIDNADGKGNFWKVIDPTTVGLPDGTHYVYLSSSFLNYPKDIANIANAKTEATQASSPNTTTGNTSSGVSTATSKGLETAIYNMLQQEKNWTDDVKYSSRIFAMPFQFTNSVDYRPFASKENGGLQFGRKYLENIITESPVVYLVPGIPNYMPGINDEEQSYIDAYMKAVSSGTDVGSMVAQKILGTDARYYDFYPAYSEYIRYVNLLCRMSAIYMKIENLVGPDGATKYGKFNWGKWSNISYNPPTNMQGYAVWDNVKSDWVIDGEKLTQTISDNIFNDEKYIKFYVDSNMSISESNSNSTTESKIASLFDTVEGLVKEVGFFTNNNSVLSGIVDLSTNTANEVLDGVSSTLDKDSSAGLSKIIGNASHVLTGSNVIFPELWGDSSYKKSYSFTVNLVSPYGDTESIYLNIIVPMMHLIALSFPRQTSANSFKSPFLVKAFVKGWFATDLAIVDSISIEKGGDGSAWNIIGLPTEVKISISITDLYSNLMITSSGEPSLYFNNNGLIQFLAVNCGMDISRPNIMTKIDSVVSTYLQSLFDAPTVIVDRISQWFRNMFEPITKIGGF